jgi:hypothetical protein
MSYIVFQNSFKGFKHLRQFDNDSLEELIKNITEGPNKPTQHFMYYIYKEHQMAIPLFATRFNTYKFVKAIAGSKVNDPKNEAHEYALTHNSSMAWFFSDDIYGDHY